jgi:hypothetical protein
MNPFFEDAAFWENAIDTRRSVRSYRRQAVETNAMTHLKSFAENVQAPFGHSVKVVFFKTRENAQLANHLRKPPQDAAAFTADTSSLLGVAAAGFIGELTLLCAQGLGICSCWFGHYILSEVERLAAGIDIVPKNARPAFGVGYGKGCAAGRHAVCVSPLGYFEQGGIRALDRLMTKMMSFRRKPIAELLTGNTDYANFPQHIQYALDMARKAPSAGNTQHWRFNVSGDCSVIEIAKIKGYSHFKWEHPDVDAGACAAHFWIGLQCRGIACQVQQLLDADRVVWRFLVG